MEMKLRMIMTKMAIIIKTMDRKVMEHLAIIINIQIQRHNNHIIKAAILDIQTLVKEKNNQEGTLELKFFLENLP